MKTYKKATYYFKKDGTMAVNRWIKKHGDYYYFNAKGKMLKNRWLNLNGKKYFLDGPGPYTARLLNALKKNKSVATFFVVGSSLSASGIQSQMSATNKQLRSIIGHNATVMRPPYGGYNSTVAANVGAPMILWSIDTLDWKTLNTQSTVNTVMNEVK